MNLRLNIQTSARALAVTLLGCIALSCSRPTAPERPFYRFVEDVGEEDSAGEIKVELGRETRNVFYTHYRTRDAVRSVAADGTVGLRQLVNPDRLNPAAAGILVSHMPETEQRVPGMVHPSQRVEYHALPPGFTSESISSERISLGNTDAAGAPRRFWTREVLPPQWRRTTQWIKIPPDARVAFGIGVEPGVLLGAPATARFSVAIETGRNVEELYEEDLDPQAPGQADHWFDRSVDLAAFAGKRARLIFATEAVRDPAANSTAPPLVAPVFGSPVLYSAAPEQKTRPRNVLLVSLDTLRADHLGAYGYPLETSPNFDAFAKRGMLFENAIAPSSWTTPSHASIFTGLHPVVHGAGISSKGYRLKSELETLAEVARREGFLTAAYTEGVAVRGRTGFSQGFDLYSDGPGDQHHGIVEQTFGAASAWLDQYGEQPFMLFMHTYEPHVLYKAPDRFWKRFTDVPPNDDMADHPELYKEHLAAWYDAEIAYTDYALGNFLDNLEEKGLLENTLLIIFSDHGEELYEHGHAGHINNTYDEVLHVPLFIRLPGDAPPAGRISRVVTTTDIFATVADFMEWDVDIPPDSISLLPLMNGQDDDEAYPRALVHSHLVRHVIDYDRSTGKRIEWSSDALRTLDDKYIRTDRVWVGQMLEQGTEPGPEHTREYIEEFFDIDADPGETHNLANVRGDRLEHYRSVLERRLSLLENRYKVKLGIAPSSEPLSADEIAELEALGYL